MPVAMFHLNVQPKHMVISLIIPHVTIQLSPYADTKIPITTNATAPPSAILFFKFLLIYVYSPLFFSLNNSHCSFKHTPFRRLLICMCLCYVIKFMAGNPTGLPVGGTAFNLPFFVLLNNFYASLLFWDFYIQQTHWFLFRSKDVNPFFLWSVCQK